MDDGLKPLECGDRVKLYMLNDRHWHGKRGTLQAYNTTYNQGHKMTVYTVKMDIGQTIKCERKSLIPLDMENINKDAEVLPEYVPPIPEPKDGDHISNHKGHEIVDAEAGGVTYKYCRTCKIEVKEGGRIMRGSNATMTIDGIEVGRFDSVNIKAEMPPLITGDALDCFATHYGVKRQEAGERPKTDEELRKELLKVMGR